MVLNLHSKKAQCVLTSPSFQLFSDTHLVSTQNNKTFEFIVRNKQCFMEKACRHQSLKSSFSLSQLLYILSQNVGFL